jgi:hypothetical protein
MCLRLRDMACVADLKISSIAFYGSSSVRRYEQVIYKPIMHVCNDLWNSNDSTQMKCSQQSKNACIIGNNNPTKMLIKTCQKVNTKPLFMNVLGALAHCNLHALCTPLGSEMQQLWVRAGPHRLQGREVFLCCAVCPLSGESNLTLLVAGFFKRGSGITTASVAVTHQLLFLDIVVGFQTPRATVQKVAMVEEGLDMHEQGVMNPGLTARSHVQSGH